MTNPLENFHELLKSFNDRSNFSFCLNSSDLNHSEVLYCKEMVNQGKLDSVDICTDSYNAENFTKISLFYERNLSIARRKVYVYRLQFFEINVSFEHGKKVELSPKTIKIKYSKTIQENEIIAMALKASISFIRCWVIKDYIDYESAYTLLKHYSKNDGIITIPEFLSQKFLDSFDKLLTSNIKDPEPISSIHNFFLPKVSCLNDKFQYTECPYCNEKNISNSEVTICRNCKKSFM